MTVVFTLRTCINCRQPRNAATGKWYPSRSGKRWFCKRCVEMKNAGIKARLLRGKNGKA